MKNTISRRQARDTVFQETDCGRAEEASGKISKMEEEVATVRNLLRALNLMVNAETIRDERDEMAFLNLIWLAGDVIKRIETLRGEVFCHLHLLVFGDAAT